MKKIISSVLALTLGATCLAGCGGAASSAPAASTESSSAASSTATAATSDWPKQPVNMMCPASAGGGTDTLLRLENEWFTKKTGQPFVITNQTGITGYEQTHQANTDGYNFICGTTTIFTSVEDGTLSYDWQDYEMVAFIPGNYNTIVCVQGSSPYQTINDLLDAAKADPSSVTGGISAQGQPYMFSKALADATDIDLYFVDTGNTSERNAALLGGQVDYIITNTTGANAYLESGDFRALAIDGTERYALAPDIPTFKEQGVDFCFVGQPMVYLAPKGTPAEACEAMNAYLNEMFQDTAFIENYEATTKQLVTQVPSIADSVKMATDYAATLKPYIG